MALLTVLSHAGREHWINVEDDGYMLPDFNRDTGWMLFSNDKGDVLALHSTQIAAITVTPSDKAEKAAA